MNQDFEKNLRNLKNISLSENEKVLMRNNLKLHIKNTVPFKAESNVRKSFEERLNNWRDLKSPKLSIISLYFNQLKNMPALIIALIVALSGGTSVAAVNSLPGDALYGVKVSVNEPIAGLFTVSQEAKTVRQGKLAERRLQEVEDLVANGVFDEEKRSEIEARLNDHINKFSLNASLLASDKNKAISSSELTARLEAVLIAHQDVLGKITIKVDTATSTREELAAIISLLKKSEGDIKGHREKIDLRLGEGFSKDDKATTTKATTTKESLLGKQGAAENVLASALRAYERVKLELSSEVNLKAGEIFAKATSTLAEGKSKAEKGEYADASEKFHEVIKLANEGRVIVLSSSISRKIEGVDNKDRRDDFRKNKDRVDGNNGNASSTRIRNTNDSNGDERGSANKEREEGRR